jgi:hypothetical protein
VHDSSACVINEIDKIAIAIIIRDQDRRLTPSRRQLASPVPPHATPLAISGASSFAMHLGKNTILQILVRALLSRNLSHQSLAKLARNHADHEESKREKRRRDSLERRAISLAWQAGYGRLQ